MKVCVLSSGSKGNSTYIETKNHKILIDVGNSCSYIEKALRKINVEPNEIDIVLITHSHIDHIGGLKVFSKKYKPLIYISNKILEEAKISLENVNTEEDININLDIIIKSMRLSHDVKDIKGYIIEENEKSVVYITDTGYINEKTLDQIKNKNVYIFESNHDVENLMKNSNYPYHTKIRILSDKGHLSNKDASYYLTKIIGEKTKKVILAHLSEQNNTEELAFNELSNALIKKNIKFNNIIIARQNEMTELIEL